MKIKIVLIIFFVFIVLSFGSIVLAATFGKTDDGTGSSASSLDKKAVSSSTPATSGTATSMTVRTWLSATGSTTIKAVIYDASTTEPWNLLAVSDEVTVTSTVEEAIEFPLSGANQIAVTSGTIYWIGFHWKDPGTPSVNLSRDATANMRIEAVDTYSDGPADPFGATTLLTGPIDVYVTYTESSPPAVSSSRIMQAIWW